MPTAWEGPMGTARGGEQHVMVRRSAADGHYALPERRPIVQVGGA